MRKIDLNKQFVIDVQLAEAPKLPVTCVTHGEPVHGDDLLSIDMIMRCANVNWVSKNAISMNVEGENRQVVFIDVPDGKFSDKENTALGKKKTESTSVKVARSLGVLDDPDWSRLIKGINNNDVNGSSDLTDICTIAKHGQQQNPDNSLEIGHWFFQAIYVKIYFDSKSGDLTIPHIADVIRNTDELSREIDADEWLSYGEKIHSLHKGKFFQDACSELEEKHAKGGVLRKKIFHQGHILNVAAIESENYRIGSAMRWKDRDRNEEQFSEVIVVKNNRGAIISYDKKYKVDIAETLAVVRYLEYRVGHPYYDYYWKWHRLRCPGTIKQIPHWFYNIEMDILMNSLGHCAPLTKLSLKTLFHCALIGLDEYMFHPKYHKYCNKGICVEGRGCINYKCGLPRCVKIFKESERRKKKRKMTA